MRKLLVIFVIVSFLAGTVMVFAAKPESPGEKGLRNAIEHANPNSNLPAVLEAHGIDDDSSDDDGSQDDSSDDDGSQDDSSDDDGSQDDSSDDDGSQDDSSSDDDGSQDDSSRDDGSTDA